MNIKKGYIYILIILVAIYGYFSFNSGSDKKQYTNAIDNMLTDIRREDYFAIHNKLDDSLKDKISIEDIKNYCQSIKLTKESKFKLVNIDKKNNTIKLSGIVTTKNKEQELYANLKENNNSFKFLSQKIGKVELKEKNASFPIVSSALKKSEP